MRQIPLTKGYSAIVDDEDYDFLMQWKWHVVVGPKHVYAMRNSAPVDGRRHHILMHRVLNDTPEGFDTDHANGNSLDNRRSNLRTATRTQNMWNRAPNRRCASRHKGVSWHRQHRKWVAAIQVNGRRRHIGLFDDEDAAAAAYAARARKEFGDFNRD